jgi:hypothetical protein
MSRESFMRAEADASRKFMDRFADEDFDLPSATVGYSREYRCDCGFRTDGAGEIFDHASACSKTAPICCWECSETADDVAGRGRDVCWCWTADAQLVEDTSCAIDDGYFSREAEARHERYEAEQGR